MPAKKLLQVLFLIALPTTALIAGLNEKWWLVALVVLCLTVWVLYLLIQVETEKALYRVMEMSFKTACAELEKSRFGQSKLPHRHTY